VKRLRHKMLVKNKARHAIVGVISIALALSATPAYTSLFPEGFFDRLPQTSDGQVSLTSDYLSQDSSGLIVAIGQVDISYGGYFATADKLIYNQNTKDMTLIGNVVIRDPDNTEYSADEVELTDSFKSAILESMIMVTSDGAMITADKTDHVQDKTTLLDKGTYSPCGTCIDDKGRKIGWRVRTKSILYDKENENLDLEQPILEVLGVSVAWLPWLRLPDPSNPRANGIRMPSYFYSDEIGLKLEFPYFMAMGKDTDFIIVPTITTNQGPLFNATIIHRFTDWGEISVTATGIYQFNKSVFAGTVGDKDWRGAIQASAEFTPAQNWTAGWSYSTFTDPAFFDNYNLSARKTPINEVYTQYLDADIYTNVRVQDFVVLGNVTSVQQNMQADALPNARYEQVIELEDDNGRIAISGNLLGLTRVSDSTTTANGVPYVEGYAGNKVIGTIEAGWSKQFETDAGLVLTPYLGIRGDAAHYDGGSALKPTASSLFNITPIAAIDISYPLMAVDNGSTHLIEPMVQFVYRGSRVTNLGINNDNAQSFVFDDSKLFSFNRFSGTDRQETGLRANVGIRYQANFVDGSHLSFVGGQSFHLAGINSLNVGDSAQAGTSTGLGQVSSDIVLGVRASPIEGVDFGAKMIVDPKDFSIERSAIAASIAKEGWNLSSDYSYIAADPLLGSIIDQHSIGGSVRIPIDDYWYAKAGAGWDIITNSMIDHYATIGYDDGFFSLAGHYTGSGDALNPTAQTYKVTFNLSGPDGSDYSF